MPTELTAIPGIGPKTAKSLRGLGIDSGERLYAEYITGDASAVVDALHSEQRLIRHFFGGDPPAIDPDVPPQNRDGIAAVVGFARQRGAAHRYLAPRAPYNISPEDVTASAIDWRRGILADGRDVLGVVYDAADASATVGVDLDRVGARPDAVDAGEDVVRIESDGATTLMDADVLSAAADLTGESYGAGEGLRVIGGREDSLVRLEAGADELFLVAAPRVKG